MIQFGACPPLSSSLAPVRESMTNSERLTKSETIKLYLAIDRQLIREAGKSGRSLMGLRGPELNQADGLLTDFMKIDFTDEEIEEISTLDYDSLQGMGFRSPALNGIFKKIANGVKKAVSTVVQIAKPVVKAVVGVVKAVVNVVKVAITSPIRTAMVIAMNYIKGPVAKAFLYVFVPDNAPELEKFPRVKKKRAKQLKAVDALVKHVGMDRSYVMKHLRNAIVTTYKKNPEEVLHDFANKKETEFTFTQSQLNEGEAAEDQITPANEKIVEDGLGEVVTIVATVVAALAAAVGGAVALKQAFSKPNIPTTEDWVIQADGSAVNTKTGEVIPADRNVTNDPGYEVPTPFYKTPLGISLIVVGAGALGYGVYEAVS